MPNFQITHRLFSITDHVFGCKYNLRVKLTFAPTGLDYSGLWKIEKEILQIKNYLFNY